MPWRSAGCWSAPSCSACCCRGAAGSGPTRREWAAAGRLRRRLVRHLQPGAQRRRTAPRRRHDGDAGQHRPDPDRGLRRPAAGRGLPALAAGRHRRRLRRRAADRDRHAAAPRPTSLGVVLCVVAAVTYAGGVVAQKPLLRRLPGAAGDGHRLRDGRGLLPAVGGHPGRRAGLGPGRLDRRHGLPRRGAHGAGVQHLGLRAEPDGRRQARRHHLRRPAAGDPARLAAARRGPAGPRAGRRGDLPGRRRRSPAAARGSGRRCPCPQEASPTV